MERAEYIESVRALVRERKLPLALETTQRYTTAHPEDSEGWRYRAHVFEALGNYVEASSAMSVAIKLAQREPGYYWLRGMYRLRVGVLELAEKDFTTTISLGADLNSDYYKEMAYLLRAETYRRQGKLDKAHADCLNVRDEVFIQLDVRVSKQSIMNKR